MSDRISLGRTIDTGADVTLDLPALVASRCLIQGRSGAGKSYLVRRILEQSHGHLQHLVIDPEGEYGTLREKLDYIHAGKGGDVPAEPKSAPLLARRLLELNVSAVLDLYELSPNEREAFICSFLGALVNADRELWHPLLVVIDEAHVYASEGSRDETAEAIIGLCQRGRKRGYGVLLASQRIAELSKRAAAQLSNFLIGPTQLDNDRIRAARAMGLSGKAARDVEARLRLLKPGQFYATGPAVQPAGLHLLTVAGVLTHHPEVARGRKAPPPPPPTERVRAVLAKLADLPKEAAEEEAELARLRREVAELRRSAAAAQPVGYSEEQWQERERAFGREREEWDRRVYVLQEGVRRLVAGLDDIGHMAEETSEQAAPLMQEEPPPPAVPPIERRAPAATPQPAPPVGPPADPGDLPRGAFALLETLGRHYPVVLTRSQWATLSGRSQKSSSWQQHIALLKKAGLVAVDGNEVRLTDAGLARVPVRPAPLSSAEVLERWRAGLSNPARAMLDELVLVHPRPLTREQLSARTHYSLTSSSFQAAIAELRRNGLAEVNGPEVRASETVFIGGKAR